MKKILSALLIGPSLSLLALSPLGKIPKAKIDNLSWLVYNYKAASPASTPRARP